MIFTGIDPDTGRPRLARRDRHKRHCHGCGRIFADGHVPRPNDKGLLICRDCRGGA